MAEWILDLNNELQSQSAPPDQALRTKWPKSIYRVPKIITDINPEAYMPMLASFGPYHHGRPHLCSMEQHKHRALIQYLRRIAKASKTPEDVLIEMRKVESRLLASYDSLHIEDYDCEQGHLRRHDWLKEEDKFLKLMITDGCFALEVMLAETWYFHEISEYDRHDPVFGIERKKYFAPYLARDMLLLENQLPLLALTTLAAIKNSGVEDVSILIKDFYHLSLGSPDNQMTNKDPKEMTNEDPEEMTDKGSESKQEMTNEDLEEMTNKGSESKQRVTERMQQTTRILKFIIHILNRKNQLGRSLFVQSRLKLEGPEEQNKGSSHILDLYKKMLTAEGEYLPSYDEEKVNTATELRKAGVTFRKSESNSFGDISFNGGVLSLPKLEIDDATESKLLNLIAFEHLHATADNKVTAYAIFMDNLIDTVDDVALLRTEEIISGMLGSDENIAKIFNKITKGATRVHFLDDKQVINVNRDLNDYCKRTTRWTIGWRASYVVTSFVELYLKNPWVFITLLGGLILLGLTVVQTAYTIRQYYDA